MYMLMKLRKWNWLKANPSKWKVEQLRTPKQKIQTIRRRRGKHLRNFDLKTILKQCLRKMIRRKKNAVLWNETLTRTFCYQAAENARAEITLLLLIAGFRQRQKENGFFTCWAFKWSRIRNYHQSGICLRWPPEIKSAATLKLSTACLKTCDPGSYKEHLTQAKDHT